MVAWKAGNISLSMHWILLDFEVLKCLHETKFLGSTSWYSSFSAKYSNVSISGLTCSIGVTVQGLRVLEA